MAVWASVRPAGRQQGFLQGEPNRTSVSLTGKNTGCVIVELMNQFHHRVLRNNLAPELWGNQGYVVGR